MSYNIGQFRSSQSNTINNYITPITGNDIQITMQEMQSVESDSITFKNCCINLTNALNNENCYYLRFKIQHKEKPQKFYLKLKNNNPNSNIGEQLIEEFTVNKGTQSNYSYFEVILSPNQQDYNQIIWELQRITDDYIQVNPDGSNGRIMNITIEQYAQLINLLPTLQTGSSTYLTKIGIQGPPSLLMCINKEPIRIGRSGIYEVNNGVNINFIGFVPKINNNTLDYFIMDYEY